MTEFNEMMLELINNMEGEGVDFKEDVVEVEMTIEERPDVLIIVSFVDKATEDAMQEASELMSRLH